ncbi:MAG: LodA/GoxA family CTQ-dependent oxidase [Archangium sp.]
MPTTFKIHPAIGIARVGDSEEYYLGPETSGGLPLNPDGSPVQQHDLRDAQGLLKRQAARFQVYRYEGPDDPGRPVSLKDSRIKSIVWRVHVANKKASWYEFQTWRGEHGYAPNHPLRNADVTDPEKRKEQLIIDPGPRTLDGPNKHKHFSQDGALEEPDLKGYPVHFPPNLRTPSEQSLSEARMIQIQTLGEALTDADGRLLVLGGRGHAGTTKPEMKLPSFANNDGWFDDTSDGPVQATIVFEDGTTIKASPAWVITGPPAYAPQILNIVTLYDTLYDTFVREAELRPDIFKDGLWNPDYTPSFRDEIKPLLRRPFQYNWVINIPNHPHELSMDVLGNPDSQYNPLRQFYLAHIRKPEDGNRFSNDRGVPLMPYLAGDGALDAPQDISRYMMLTQTQYFLLQQWARGRFESSAKESSARTPRPGEELDKAVLDTCAGGAFSPGIEMPWLCRNPKIYAEPFRIRPKEHLGRDGLSLDQDFAAGLEPGDVTRYMAVPWQADFNQCSVQRLTEHDKDGRKQEHVVWWWPAQRPIMVYDQKETPRRYVPWVGQLSDSSEDSKDYLTYPDNLEMVLAWKKLGFVFDVAKPGEAPNFIEVERRWRRDGEGSKEQPE